MPTTHVRANGGVELQHIADVLAKSRKVVVITGAGISTNCGIPVSLPSQYIRWWAGRVLIYIQDFRSENGLYALIQAQYDAAASAKEAVEDIDDRPTKRRKLDRSCSTAALSMHTSEDNISTPRMGLRSSRSFNGVVPSSAPAKISEEQPKAILRKRVPDMCKSPIRKGRPPGRRKSYTPGTITPSDSDEPSSSQSSTTSARTSLPNLKGKDLFDSMIWSDALTTSIFYTFISSLRQKIMNDVKSTTETHKFIKVLRDTGRLVRNYTQNIDMLESREGLCTELERGTGSRARFSQKFQKEASPSTTGVAPLDAGVEVVHLHGSLDRLRCGLCAKSSSWDEEDRHQTTLAGDAPDCPWCVANSAHREGKGRRSLAIGRLRPDIVLYGEEHPSAHLVGPLVTHDLSLGPDILLILGTSLRVHGLKIMVREFAKAVHGRGGKVIFVNQTKPPESIWGDVIDYWVEWDCDAWVEDLRERRKDIWQPPRTATDSSTSDSKPKVTAKKPQATRPDVTNGAYLHHKICDRLGRISGRIPELNQPSPIATPATLPSKMTTTTPKSITLTHQSAPPAAGPMPPPTVNKPLRTHSCVSCQQRKRRCDRQNPGSGPCAGCIKSGIECIASGPAPPTPAATAPTSAPAEDSTKRKRNSLPRPNAVRPHKENGAYLSWEIMAHLRRLCGGLGGLGVSWPSSIRKPTPLLALSLPPAQTRPQTHTQPQPPNQHVPLANMSTNIIPTRRTTGRTRLKSAKARDMSMDGDEMQLPTPPNSDSDILGPGQVTPKTQRIKQQSSISAILSSPVRAWRGG